MRLEIDRERSTPLYLQIAEAVIDQVRLGKLANGVRLPPTRDLAEELGVTRTTVIAAYRELEERGWVSSHVGRGTFVARPAATAAGEAEEGVAPQEQRGPRYISRQELRRLMRLTDRPGLLSLASGIPALDSFPVDRLRQAFDQVLEQQGAAALQYDSPEGYWPLRERIAAYLGQVGVVAHPSEVLITSGTQQGATLVARVMVQPGDVVLLDQPTYAGALDAFEGAAARVVGVPADEAGILPDALDSLARRYHPRLLYVVPACQGPAARSLPADRRRALHALARSHGFTIVEDDSFRDLRFVGEPAAPLKAQDDSNHVIHLGSFSKTLAPGLRVGYVVAGEGALEALADAKQTADLHTSTLVQRAVDAYLESGDLNDQLQRLRAVSAERRNATLAAIYRSLPKEVAWWAPEGGPFIWLRLPEDLSAVTAYMAALEHGVAFAIGAGFFPDRVDRGYIRLNFAAPRPEETEEGLRRLGAALASLGLGGSAGRAGRSGPTVL